MSDTEPTVQTLAEFQPRIAGMSFEAFAAAYPHPFLLEWRPRLEETPEFRSSVTVEPGVDSPAAGAASPESARVIQVRKTSASTGMRHITVGRTANNDIPLDAGGISKLHAYFMAPATDEELWKFVDVSTYGCTVGGQPCPKEEPVTLLRADRDAAAPRIGFADLAFTFYENPAMVLGALNTAIQRIGE
jgi:hypothetical protein